MTPAATYTGVMAGSSDAGVYDGDTLTFNVTDGAYTGINAGSYSVTVASSNGNYTVTNATATLTINRATIIATFSNETSFVYSKTAHSVRLTVSGVYAGDEVTVNTTHTDLSGTDITLTDAASGYTE